MPQKSFAPDEDPQHSQQKTTNVCIANKTMSFEFTWYVSKVFKSERQTSWHIEMNMYMTCCISPTTCGPLRRDGVASFTQWVMRGSFIEKSSSRVVNVNQQSAATVQAGWPFNLLFPSYPYQNAPFLPSSISQNELNNQQYVKCILSDWWHSPCWWGITCHRL